MHFGVNWKTETIMTRTTITITITRPLDFGAASSGASRQGNRDVGRSRWKKKKKKKKKKKRRGRRR